MYLTKMVFSIENNEITSIFQKNSEIIQITVTSYSLKNRDGKAWSKYTEMISPY